MILLSVKWKNYWIRFLHDFEISNGSVFYPSQPGIGKAKNPINFTHKTEGGSVAEWLGRRGLEIPRSRFQVPLDLFLGRPYFNSSVMLVNS